MIEVKALRLLDFQRQVLVLIDTCMFVMLVSIVLF